MARKHIQKTKSSKRLGVHIWTHTAPKRLFPQKKLSTFGTRLRLKRLVSLLYGNITSTYYTNLCTKAAKYTGKFGPNVLSLLEKRLDVGLYRIGFAKTLSQARQAIRHNHVSVNGSSVCISSYELHRGDIVRVTQASILQDISEKRMIPCKPLHFEVSYSLQTAIFLFSPQQVYYPTPVDIVQLTGAHKV